MEFNGGERASRISAPLLTRQAVCADDVRWSSEHARLDIAVCRPAKTEWARPLGRKLFAVAADFGRFALR
jgi:hypothetical protein